MSEPRDWSEVPPDPMPEGDDYPDRAALTEAPPSESLDEAWEAAEALMDAHHGAAVTLGGVGDGQYYAHIVTPPPYPEHGVYGDTPVAALRALCDLLRGSR